MTYRTIKEQIRKLGYLTEKDFALEYGDMLAEDVNDVLFELAATVAPVERRLVIERKSVEDGTEFDIGQMLGGEFMRFAEIPVRDNILLPLLLDKREPDEEYLALLTRQLGLTALLQRQPTQLSGGQQQRAAIARALITRPAVVLADEPTGNLDHQNSVEVFRLLREAAAQQHQTVVYVTHDQGLAAQADRVLRMQDGRIEEA